MGCKRIWCVICVSVRLYVCYSPIWTHTLRDDWCRYALKYGLVRFSVFFCKLASTVSCARFARAPMAVFIVVWIRLNYHRTRHGLLLPMPRQTQSQRRSTYTPLAAFHLHIHDGSDPGILLFSLSCFLWERVSRLTTCQRILDCILDFSLVIPFDIRNGVGCLERQYNGSIFRTCFHFYVPLVIIWPWLYGR